MGVKTDFQLISERGWRIFHRGDQWTIEGDKYRSLPLNWVNVCAPQTEEEVRLFVMIYPNFPFPADFDMITSIVETDGNAVYVPGEGWY